MLFWQVESIDVKTL